jgi:hypothetical protein
MKKKTIKQNLARILNEISAQARSNLSLISGLGTFVLVTLWIILFNLGWAGITTDLLEGFFEAFVVMALLFISFNVLNRFLNLSNGIIGTCNVIYLVLGILAVIGESPELILLGQNVVKMAFAITLLAIVEEWFKEG